MDARTNILKIVTNETKSSIEKLEVVTPALFSSLFYQFAKEHNIILDDEENFTRNLLQTECSLLASLQTQTSKNAALLSDSTAKAIGAIQSSNETLLNEVLKETQSLKEEIEKLKKSIYIDTLTKTFNRKWLQDNYTRDESFQSASAGVLALIDLNYFKLINDSYGHVIGDKVLVLLASEFLKLGFPVVRYGGDEFLIMFSATLSLEDAKGVLNELREKILKRKFKANEKTFTLSFSFGLAAFRKDDSCVSVLEKADKEMYRDKVEIKKRIPNA